MTFRCLVTGGAGFIGSHLVDGLIEKGHDVTVLDSLESQVHNGIPPEYLNPQARFIRGRVGETDQLRKLLQEHDVVFHDAARVGVGQSMYEVRNYVSANTLETAQMLELLAEGKHNVKKIIAASSMSIYGEGAYQCEKCGLVAPKPRTEGQLKKRQWEMQCSFCRKPLKPVATSETKPLDPTSVYAITKRDQEELCLVMGKAYGVPTVALRYFNVYGPRQSLNNPYTGVCAIFSSRLLNNHPPVIFEDGQQSRDFVHVKDIVQANLLAMEKKEADNNVFNVGTGKFVTIMEIAQILNELYGKSLQPQIKNKYREGDIRHCFSNISKIQKLGFKPTISLKDGLKELVEWGEKEKPEDKFDQAASELEERGLAK